MPNQAQFEQMKSGTGFVAALDQSGGSTPKALGLYGVDQDAYANDQEMYDMIHEMRSRIATAPAFTGGKVLGAILFEMTMDREIGGKPSAKFLWEERGVVPFLKIDKGLEDEANDVQMMKPIPGLDETLVRAAGLGIFGTKMRSVINAEVTISISDKAEAEQILLAELTLQLNALPADQNVMLKLTLPEVANLYQPLVDHPRVVRVLALSGGYARKQANEMLAQNVGIIASYSRGLTEGLSVQQSDAAFNADIEAAINSIAAASAQ